MYPWIHSQKSILSFDLYDLCFRSSNMWYYGQKRGGKSGLIPFPRVGRSGANTWNLDEDPASEQRGKLLLSVCIFESVIFH